MGFPEGHEMSFLGVYMTQGSETPIGSLKDRATTLLAGVDGVQRIGFGWGDDGGQLLRVDVAPGTDRATVARKLRPLETEIAIREVSGRIFRD
jgi:hypothetical protein